VFAFVADPENDPLWCDKVLSCERVAGDGAGAVYRARHRPTRLKAAMDIEVRVVELDPPGRVTVREEDEDGVFHVTYLLEEAGDGTRFTQVSEIEWKLPRPLQALANRMVPRHLDGQMRRLKRRLEA
jgi:hypothetical protein